MNNEKIIEQGSLKEVSKMEKLEKLFNYCGFDVTQIDTFKTYEGYEGRYIAEPYIRYKYHDTVLEVFNTLDELLEWNDSNEHMDATMMYVLQDGTATDCISY